MPDPLSEFAVTRQIDGKGQVRASDGRIADLAGRQYGVVTRAQLLKLGIGEDAVDARLASGRLHRLHRGVYAVGHTVVSRDGHWLAAVFSAGAGAVLSHGSAAELWGIWRPKRSGRIDVSTPRSTRSASGIHRRYLRLSDDEFTVRRRIPVTTLARTLLDIAGETSAEGLEGAIREAEYLHRFQIEGLERLLVHHPGKRGARAVRTCLIRLGRGPKGRRRSKLEDKFATLLAQTDLPQPELNALLDLGGRKIEADCLWRAQRLIVELDGGQAHRTRVAFEEDRERDRRIQANGWRTIRVTWRQLEDPATVLADLRQLLSLEFALSRQIGGQKQTHGGFVRDNVQT